MTVDRAQIGKKLTFYENIQETGNIQENKNFTIFLFCEWSLTYTYTYIPPISALNHQEDVLLIRA